MRFRHQFSLCMEKKDKNFYSYAEMLHKRIPDSQLTFIKDVKHHIPTKAAFELNDVIRQFIYTHEHMVEDAEVEVVAGAGRAGEEEDAAAGFYEDAGRLPLEREVVKSGAEEVYQR